MKKFVLVLMALALLLNVGAGAALAQGSTTSKAPGTWVSSINIQNTGTAEAQVVISFYDANGTDVLDFAVSPNIAVGGSRSLYVPTDVTGLNNGQFSAVVSSSQPLQVVVNSSSTGPATAGAYTGLQSDQIGQTLYFPGLYKAYYGFNSEMILQNTDAANATAVNVTFYSQATGAAVGTVGPLTIKGNASMVLALQDVTQVVGGNATGLVSAKVSSDKALAGVANIWTGAGKGGEFSDYDGLVGGSSTTIYTPALYRNYYGFISALTVMNLGTAATTVKLTYSNGTNYTQDLLPNQAFQWLQEFDNALPQGNTAGVFSAKIEFPAGVTPQPIASLVTVEHKVAGSLASYNGPATASTTINCPVTMKSFYGWFTAETVQNVGAANANITITYASGETTTVNNIAPNGTYNFVEKGTGTALGNGKSVAAKITSSQPLVAVVQENSETRYATTPGDYLLAYTCVSQ